MFATTLSNPAPKVTPSENRSFLANPVGVTFVAKFNKIRREHALRSVQRIQNAGIHIMGVVINDIDFEGKDSYYYSYYYYQNRYYSSHYKTSPEPGGRSTNAKEKIKREEVES